MLALKAGEFFYRGGAITLTGATAFLRIALWLKSKLMKL
jgi:hypothetical protein